MGTKTVFRNARVVDGTGAPWKMADVGVSGKKVVEVGPAGSLTGDDGVECDGLVLCPGFIDIHTHSDITPLADGRCMSKVMQGVTTEVAGLCGSSSCIPGDPAAEELGRYGLKCDWRGVSEYLDVIKRSGTSVNIATLVGHGTLRSIVVGKDERAATQAELAEMAALLHDALTQGAFGLSSGLEYPPGFYADSEKIVRILEPMKRTGGLYATHIRDEGERLLESVEEAIEVGRSAKVAVEISHIKAVGPTNWGKVETALELLESARERGIDIAADAYPYTASSTSLGIILPDWAHSGGPAQTVKRLKDPQTRARLQEYAERVTRQNGGFERIVVISVESERNKIYEGKNLEWIAADTGVSACAAAFRLLIEEQMAVRIVRHGMSEDDLDHVLAHRLVSVCSDGSCLASDGPLSEGGKVHPRNFGAFARVFAEFVRVRKVLRLEEAVRKMTSLPAARLGLFDRGLIRPGFFADLVLFDPEKITDTATYDDPLRYPTGIESVWVNGTRVVQSGVHTGAMPGEGLRMRLRA